MYEGRLASRAAGASAVILQAHFLPLCLLSNGRAGVLKMAVLAGMAGFSCPTFILCSKYIFIKTLSMPLPADRFGMSTIFFVLSRSRALSLLSSEI